MPKRRFNAEQIVVLLRQIDLMGRPLLSRQVGLSFQVANTRGARPHQLENYRYNKLVGCNAPQLQILSTLFMLL